MSHLIGFEFIENKVIIRFAVKTKINSVFDSVVVNRINDWSGGFFSRELICKWDKIF